MRKGERIVNKRVCGRRIVTSKRLTRLLSIPASHNRSTRWSSLAACTVDCRSSWAWRGRNCEESSRGRTSQWRWCDCGPSASSVGEFPARLRSNLSLCTSALPSTVRRKSSASPSNLLSTAAATCSLPVARTTAHNQTSGSTARSWSASWWAKRRPRVAATPEAGPSNVTAARCPAGDTNTSCSAGLSASDSPKRRVPSREPRTRTTFCSSCMWDSECRRRSLPLPTESR